MLKEELEKKLSEREHDFWEASKNTEELEKELKHTKSSLSMCEDRLREVKVDRVYVEGQLSVLKRLSGLYPEERMTHQEWASSEREILSEHPLPF